MGIKIGKIYQKSADIIARDFGGEIIIIASSGSTGHVEDEIFSLNPTGVAVWRLVDGKRNLSQICTYLTEQFDALPETIEEDVLELVDQLVQQKILVEVNPA